MKSEETQFEKNNIQLDCYYGFYGSDTVFKLSDINYEFVGFGVYFCNDEDLNSISSGPDTAFDDYHSIENHIFIKEILSHEALNGEYSFTNKRGLGVQYTL